MCLLDVYSNYGLIQWFFIILICHTGGLIFFEILSESFVTFFVTSDLLICPYQPNLVHHHSWFSLTGATFKLPFKYCVNIIKNIRCIESWRVKSHCACNNNDVMYLKFSRLLKIEIKQLPTVYSYIPPNICIYLVVTGRIITIMILLQDCVLFHDTIFHNLQYGDLNRSAEDVYEASKMAELHESVLTWPKVTFVVYNPRTRTKISAHPFYCQCRFLCFPINIIG